MSLIADNLGRVRETIAAACGRAQRDPASVTLVAVSKTQPPEAILEAVSAGVQHFGENRVEEASDKIPFVMNHPMLKGYPAAITWHMIGHVQSRKVKDVLPLFQVVHSVDSFKLAEKFSRLLAETHGTLDVLLETNVSGEASKSGLAASGWSSDPVVRARLWQEVQQIVELPGLRLRGLMTMAPIVEHSEQTRPVFESLAGLRAALAEAFRLPLPDLSMGMTDDYPVAIECGATLVRIGRAIFGERRM